ncbi:MAG: DNA alkylation repair protein [Patescibacteria group bacterium]
MNKLHQEILKIIQKEAEETTVKTEKGSSYGGHKDLNYPLSRPEERTIAKEFLKKHQNLRQSEFIDLLDSLYNGKSTNEKSIAGLLLENGTKYRRKLDPQKLDKWLEYLDGWAQVDSLCQSNFPAKEVLANWEDWKKLIKSLNKSENINKRRASLVLLVKSVRESKDEKLANLSFEMIANLKTEKDKLITKAISWLLREMIKNYRQRIENYLEENKNSLPSIAIRETTNKLKTGKK